MAVRGTSVSQRFDAIKKANPGMGDSAAMQKAISASSTAVAKEVKAHKTRKKKISWVEKLKMGVTKQFAKSGIARLVENI